MANGRVKAKAKVKAKARPIKAGSTNRGGNGGIFTTKVIAIRRKKNG